jgi:hypothetical protein
VHKTKAISRRLNVIFPDTRPISFTYPPVASMWVVTLHNLFLYSDLPLPCHPPSYWLWLFSSQTFSRINNPTFSNLTILHTYSPMKMEQTECSETSAYKIQTPGNCPVETTQVYKQLSAWQYGVRHLLQWCFASHLIRRCQMSISYKLPSFPVPQFNISLPSFLSL